MMDLQESWDAAASFGDAVPLHFYSVLFLRHPALRALFPLVMARQRDRLVGALGYIVANAADTAALLSTARRLGVVHRKYGVRTEHYEAFGTTLIDTLAYFLGESWTDELRDAWLGAYQSVASAMIDAADAEAAIAPRWWDADVVDHQQRTAEIAVITLRPKQHYPYEPGQSLSLTCQSRPNVWRYYSPANATRPDNSIEIHVRMAYGGQLSPTLVHGLRVGDTVRIGPPCGEALRLADGELLMIAGGTGLAPLKAILEQAVAKDPTRSIDLFVGCRNQTENYDARSLVQLVSEYPAVRLNAVFSRDPSGKPPDPVSEALRQRRWGDRDIFLCGSDRMVEDGVARCRAHGYTRLHFEFPAAWFYGPLRYRKGQQ